MRKIARMALLSAILSITCSTFAWGSDAARDAKNPLSLKVFLPENPLVVRDPNIPLVFILTNHGPTTERIFAETKPVGGYIKLSIKDESGKHFSTQREKFRNNAFSLSQRYVELKQDECFGIHSKIDAFGTGVVFQPGKYEVTAECSTPHNKGFLKGESPRNSATKFILEFKRNQTGDAMIVTLSNIAPEESQQE